MWPMQHSLFRSRKVWSVACERFDECAGRQSRYLTWMNQHSKKFLKNRLAISTIFDCMALLFVCEPAHARVFVCVNRLLRARACVCVCVCVCMCVCV